jgi:general stress protein 26
MLETKAKPDAVDVSDLLAGAAKTMRSARYCWLATAAEAGAPHARPMGRILNDPGEDEWKIRFLTDGRSHKAADMRRASEVTVVFQHDPDLAFVSLTGKAALHEEPTETRRRWKAAYDVYFPGEIDRANAIFVEVAFGLRATRLERDAGGWRLVGG